MKNKWQGQPTNKNKSKGMLKYMKKKCSKQHTFNNKILKNRIKRNR